VVASTSIPAAAGSTPPEPAPAVRQVTIVIPAHNEAGAIGDVLTRLKAQTLPGLAEIIVVDDGSSDGTGDIAEEHGARVVRHVRNRGYGSSLKTGIRAAGTEYILTMDADGQHRPEDVAKLFAAVSGPRPADCVSGHRTSLIHSPLWRMPGKWVLKLMARILTRKKIPDLNCGLRIARREVLMKYIHLCPAGFSFSTTITLALLSRGYGIEFVPIQVERRVGKSMVSVSTGFQTIMLVLRLASLFNPLRVFLPLAMLFILFGIGWTIPYLIDGQGVTVLSMMSILTGVLLFGMGLICDQVAQLRLERFE
jgi:glycosyltransferase involved in cell wall biosynthesis